MRNCFFVLAVSCCLACLTVGILAAIGGVLIAQEEDSLYVSEDELSFLAENSMPSVTTLPTPEAGSDGLQTTSTTSSGTSSITFTTTTTSKYFCGLV